MLEFLFTLLCYGQVLVEKKPFNIHVFTCCVVAECANCISIQGFIMTSHVFRSVTLLLYLISATKTLAQS